ncbi:hypothetical protein B0H16DRAFT_1843838 [Mycena metata]|uniref:Uncharacterized protein n=1 Tax=Mycena metata TaxID=1033252 RepID=A0AAD7DMX6_9AGAR|nr:hypothetical protein B0H16DRAFT_1843838 [Mycena metata]
MACLPDSLSIRRFDDNSTSIDTANLFHVAVEGRPRPHHRPPCAVLELIVARHIDTHPQARGASSRRSASFNLYLPAQDPSPPYIIHPRCCARDLADSLSLSLADSSRLTASSTKNAQLKRRKHFAADFADLEARRLELGGLDVIEKAYAEPCRRRPQQERRACPRLITITGDTRPRRRTRLARGSSLEYKIIHNPETVDLRLSLTYSAAESVVDEPLPVDYYEGDKEEQPSPKKTTHHSDSPLPKVLQHRSDNVVQSLEAPDGTKLVIFYMPSFAARARANGAFGADGVKRKMDKAFWEYTAVCNKIIMPDEHLVLTALLISAPANLHVVRMSHLDLQMVKGVSRLVVIRILLEISMPSSVVTFTNIFFPRNVPKYRQFLETLQRSAARHSRSEAPDPDTREDR